MNGWARARPDAARTPKSGTACWRKDTAAATNRRPWSIMHTAQDWEGLSEQTYSYMRGHVAALLFQFDRHGHWGNLYRAFLELPYFFMTVAVRSLRKRAGRLIGGSSGELYALPLGLQIRGAIAGCMYFLRNRRVPAYSGPK